MKWRKLGRIFAPQADRSWSCSHASYPIPRRRDGDRYRVYFSSRDGEGRSHIDWIEIDLNEPAGLLERAREPVLSPGPRGAFDESGVTPACLVARGRETWLYYLGWRLGRTAPFHNFIGLAVQSAPGEPFRRVSRSPILGRSPGDPHTLSYPWVMRDGEEWRMYYGSHLRWGIGPRDRQPVHVIKYAVSGDGRRWKRDDHVCIDVSLPRDFAFARPCVVRVGSRYHMWYCWRGERYRIGYAASRDGRSWERRDAEAGIDVSDSGWDDTELCYPCVFRHEDRWYMLYNGNGYGETGFGLALLEDAGAMSS